MSAFFILAKGPYNKELFYDPLTFDTDLFGIGNLSLSVFTAKPEDQIFQDSPGLENPDKVLRSLFGSGNDSRVFVSVNGQSHARYSKADLKIETNLKFAGERSIVLAESTMDSGEDIFNTARDGLSDNKREDQVLKNIYETLRKSEELEKFDRKIGEHRTDNSGRRNATKIWISL